MRMFEFFRIWLVVLGAALVVGGVSLTLLASSPVGAVFNRLIDPAFWQSQPDAATRKFQAWCYSVAFATMAGWGFGLAMIAANAFSSHQAWAWWAIAGSIAIWFPLDTGRSLYHRVWANAIGNTALLVLVAIPLIGTFGEFH
jgi:hypothetical protein